MGLLAKCSSTWGHPSVSLSPLVSPLLVLPSDPWVGALRRPELGALPVQDLGFDLGNGCSHLKGVPPLGGKLLGNECDVESLYLTWTPLVPG